MIGPLFRRRRRDPDIPAVLYGAIVAGARNPALYRDIGIADTVDGRFEAVILHMVLAVRRLSSGDEEMRAIGQAVFDMFCVEMDRSLREMGVGDLSVPKRMRRIGEVYYGRTAAYGGALDARDSGQLRESFDRNIPSREGAKVASAALAAYMIASDAALGLTSGPEILRGRLPFADPAGFLGAEANDDGHAGTHRGD